MPNWVYSGITISTPLTKKQKEILKKIEKVGSICEYYIPRDKEILETRSPENIVSQKEYDEIQIKNKEMVENQKEGEHIHLDRSITQEISDNLIKKYGTNNWYDWSNNNWGTKWGDCDLDIQITKHPHRKKEEYGEFSFESAWSPISAVIIEMLLKDFPDIHYRFQEEQEWGGIYEFEKGENIYAFNYDYPNWGEPVDYKDYVLAHLIDDHPNYEHGAGYYLEWGQEYAGTTLEEAKEYVDEFQK